MTKTTNGTWSRRGAHLLLLSTILAIVAGLFAPRADAAPPTREPLERTDITIGPKTDIFTLKCQTIFGIPVVTTAPLSQKHCDALEAIYNSTGGPGWTYGWHPGAVPATDPCSFPGVWCNDQVGIYRLELGYNGLAGALPAQLGDLDQLTWLSLSANAITSLPATIGELDKLERLSVSLNQLTYLPNEIGDMDSLEVLMVEQNQLWYLPASLTNLSGLRILLAGGNQLASMPMGLNNLTALTELSLENNQLTGLPAVAGNANLDVLYVDGNNIGGSIGTVFNQVAGMNLTRLGLGNNNLSGQIPATMAALPLVYLEMSGNGCLTADAATEAHLATIASFTGTADDALDVGCPKLMRAPITKGPLVPLVGSRFAIGR